MSRHVSTLQQEREEASAGQPEEEEGSLTSEEEQTADQLLADIQNAVDEMLHDFQASSLSPESTPTPPPSQPLVNPSSTASTDKVCLE